MNLIARITLLFVFVSLLVFIIGGVISLNIMMREVDFEQRRFLIERMDRADRLIRKRQPQDTLKWHKMMIIPLAEQRQESIAFSDTLVMHTQLERLETHLKMEMVKNIEGKSYLVSLYDIVIEPDDIKDGVVESLVTMYLILLAAVLILGFIASYFILRPFNQTLSIIQKFSLKGKSQDVEFPKSNVSEFKRLNLFLKEMTDKVKLDYKALKEFSENASHELQTPLAIVQSKLEVLMDSENLSEDQVNQIVSTQNTIRRLSNLSNSLSLFTKIENKEFEDVSDIDVSIVIPTILDEFKELIQLKSISLETDIKSGLKVKADKVLFELLLTNLINNAIRHNHEQGSIQLKINSDSLEISNTGSELTSDPSELFKRFKKSNQSSNSLGLGLAISKMICDLYGFDIGYTYQSKQHTLKVVF